MHYHDAPRLIVILYALIALSCSLSACEDSSPPPVIDIPIVGGEMMNGPTIQGGLRLDQPRAGDILSSQQVTVSGIHVTSTEVMINGMQVPVTSQRFSITLTLEEGSQLITVSGGEDQVDVNVLVDATPPQVSLIEPFFGTHIDSTRESLVTIIGQAVDSLSGIEKVLVNGQEVQLESNGRFQYTYEPEVGLNRPLIIATDRAGHEQSTSRGFLFGRFNPWESQLGRSVKAELKQTGFAVIEGALEQAVLNGLIDDLLSENLLESEDIKITEIIYQDVDIQLSPQSGYIRAEISLTDLKVFFELTTPSTRGDVLISPARLSANLYLTPRPDGTLDAQLRDREVSLENLNARVDNGLLDAALSFVEGYVSDLAERALLAVLDEVLINELISSSLFSPTINVLDVELQLRALIQEFTVEPSGAVLEAGLQMTDLPVINQSLGYLSLPDTQPAPPLMYQASLDLDLNAFHLIFSHLWYGGLLNQTLNDLIDDAPSTLAGVLLNGFTDGKLLELMGPTETVVVRLRPSLPPIARFDQTRRDVLFVDLVDLMIDFTTPTGQIWFTGGFDLTAEIKPTIINNELSLQVAVSSSGRSLDEPIFPVKSKELIQVMINLIQDLPNQLGDEGLNQLFSFSELNYYGLNFSSALMQTQLVPNPILQIGLNLDVYTMFQPQD